VSDSVRIKTSIITKRLFFRYYPFCLFLLILMSANEVIIKKDPLIFLGIYIVAAHIYSIINYFFIISPLIIFKPINQIVRLTLLLGFMILFILLLKLLIEIDTIAFIGALYIGIFIVWFYHIEERQCLADIKADNEKARRITNEKKVLESHLKLLQAQIEPHFLFNTLTSIESLDDTDPDSAKKMQINFIQYLRTTLAKTRAEVTTVGQEVELIRAYLDIFKVRMGERLDYTVSVSDDIKEVPFPSMLVQPIVENSIKHGLEPKIEGGEIRVNVKKISNKIRWEIADTGIGLSENSDLGVGLSNILERLNSLYEAEGQLIMEENRPSGLKIFLEVPYGRN